MGRKGGCRPWGQADHPVNGGQLWGRPWPFLETCAAGGGVSSGFRLSGPRAHSNGWLLLFPLLPKFWKPEEENQDLRHDSCTLSVKTEQLWGNFF